MEIQRIEITELSLSGSALQTCYWAQVKQNMGWKPYAFKVQLQEESFTVLVLVKSMLYLFSLAYIPFAPRINSLPLVHTESFLKEFCKQLRHVLPRTAFALRLDLPFEEINDENVLELRSSKFRMCKESVQPEATVRIDLKWGYKAVTIGYRDRAKRALRKTSQDFEVGQASKDAASFKRWYAIYLETARRDGFSARSASYLRSLLEIGQGEDSAVYCKLLLATMKRKIVGGIIVLFSPYEAVYLYGASKRLDGVSCSYVLQDYAIRMACERGCSYYDLYGICGPKERGSHLKGLEVFKLAFGGQPYYRTPSTDYVYHPLVWHAYSISEKMRYRFKRRVKLQEGDQPNS